MIKGSLEGSPMNVKGKNQAALSGPGSTARFFSILPVALGAIGVATYILYYLGVFY